MSPLSGVLQAAPETVRRWAWNDSRPSPSVKHAPRSNHWSSDSASWSPLNRKNGQSMAAAINISRRGIVHGAAATLAVTQLLPKAAAAGALPRLSGLAWPSGATDYVTPTLAGFRARPLDVRVVFGKRNTWQDIRTAAGFVAPLRGNGPERAWRHISVPSRAVPQDGRSGSLASGRARRVRPSSHRRRPHFRKLWQKTHLPNWPRVEFRPYPMELSRCGARAVLQGYSKGFPIYYANTTVMQ